MLDLFKTKSYRKAIKKYSKSSNFDIKKVEIVIKMIQRGETLDRKYKDHELKGKFQGIRECHIEFDLLLLYQTDNVNQLLVLVNIGTHSDLFGELDGFLNI